VAEASIPAIEPDMVFADFDNHRMPFLGGQGPALNNCRLLPKEQRSDLRERLPIWPDGSIHLAARAWAIRAADFTSWRQACRCAGLAASWSLLAWMTARSGGR
jgi:hypothetical protein